MITSIYSTWIAFYAVSTVFYAVSRRVADAELPCDKANSTEALIVRTVEIHESEAPELDSIEYGGGEGMSLAQEAHASEPESCSTLAERGNRRVSMILPVYRARGDSQRHDIGKKKYFKIY